MGSFRSIESDWEKNINGKIPFFEEKYPLDGFNEYFREEKDEIRS